MQVSEPVVLQALRLKGLLTAESGAAATGASVEAVLAEIDRLVGAGLATAAGAAVRITPAGRERLVALLDVERRGVDQLRLTAAYEEFGGYNDEVKAVVTAWQLRAGATPNDHSDAASDTAVITRLVALHERFAPLLDRMIAMVPRLTAYGGRFAHAVARLRAGEHAFVARPMIDSFHTVWFELHEDLIGLLGRTRAEEAAAGRADGPGRPCGPAHDRRSGAEPARIRPLPTPKQ